MENDLQTSTESTEEQTTSSEVEYERTKEIEIRGDDHLSERNEDESEQEDKIQNNETPKELYGLVLNEKGKTIRFLVPKTKAPFGFSSPLHWNFIEWLKYGSSLLYLILFFFDVGPLVWVFLFVFWRIAYNGGLGYILHIQSKTKILTKYHTPMPGHPINDLIKRVLSSLMEKDYNYDVMPPEFNAWITFRGLVEIILAHDLVTYILMCLAFFEPPKEFTIFVMFCYTLGIFFCVFSLWAKLDAYQVVSDFAWYWGDFFFLMDQKLTFNRIFALFPHPMYTVGYSFYYGFSLITQSYTVFYVSLFAHISQLLFLGLVENPHIEKTYGPIVKDPGKKTVYQQTYFRRDLIVFKNFDFFRSSDMGMLIIILYSVFMHLLDLPHWYYIMHVVVWRLFHNGVLGYVLHQQSKKKLWTLHFFKLGLTKEMAFEEWKRLYNMSLTLNYVAVFSVALKMAQVPSSFYVGLTRLTLGGILIALNIWSSVETFEVLEEFGWFYGDFFIEEMKPKKLYYTGIYRFLNNPDTVLGFAGYYGLSLISGSWAVFGTSLFSQFCNWVFLKYVETPHMKKLYGDSVRKHAGFQKGISEIIEMETATLLKRKQNAELQIKKVSEVINQVQVEVKGKIGNLPVVSKLKQFGDVIGNTEKRSHSPKKGSSEPASPKKGKWKKN